MFVVERKGSRLGFWFYALAVWALFGGAALTMHMHIPPNKEKKRQRSWVG